MRLHFEVAVIFCILVVEIMARQVDFGWIYQNDGGSYVISPVKKRIIAFAGFTPKTRDDVKWHL